MKRMPRFAGCGHLIQRTVRYYEYASFRVEWSGICSYLIFTMLCLTVHRLRC
ncbi:hypothetical protein D3C75_795430 [compost metagenome]